MYTDNSINQMSPLNSSLKTPIYPVLPDEFKGELKDFSKEIVQRMMEYQVEQGNKADYHVFEGMIHAYKTCGGFDWRQTKEGYEYWYNTMHRQFNKPKQPKVKKLLGYKPKPTTKIEWCKPFFTHEDDAEPIKSLVKEEMIAKFKKKGYLFQPYSPVCARVIEAGVLDLWFDEVREEVNETILVEYEDEFDGPASMEIYVSKKGIYCPEEDVWLDPHILKHYVNNTLISLPAYDDGRSVNHTTSYDVSCSHINIGCKKRIAIEDIKKVVDHYFSLQ